MTRPYNERRNRQVMILVERRKMPQKEAATLMGITYENFRKILSRLRKCHKMSQNVTPLPHKKPLHS